jgi:Predicted tRNA(5-methylaminomethyl-2-thiouridylate) methyltransferase, contains the PP-loop ATPase domain
MFSGGLDSTITVHLLKSMGLDVLALHFVLPFYSAVGNSHAEIKEKSLKLSVPLRIEEDGEEYVSMFKDPHFGYGKNINPCIDCRIHRLRKAALIMEQEGALFIATGEVLGQRPMSQHKNSLNAIEKRSGLRGYLLRPLSAKLLNPTIPEEKGWVQRESLLSWWGRGRKDQIAYAKQHGLAITMPAGGCLLTHADTAKRFVDLQKFIPEFSLSDFKLIAYGRHFRLAPTARLIVARTDAENTALEKLVESEDHFFMMTDVLGPLGILRGTCTAEEIEKACGIVARYSKARMQPQVNVTVTHKETTSILNVRPAVDADCIACRV